MSRVSRFLVLRRLLQNRLLAVPGVEHSAESKLSRHVIRASVRGESSSLTVKGSEGSHTSKWMSNYANKSPQNLINEVPPIEVRARVVACEGSRDPALGHPVEFICLDLEAPAICKYCGLRYVQANHHH